MSGHPLYHKDEGMLCSTCVSIHEGVMSVYVLKHSLPGQCWPWQLQLCNRVSGLVLSEGDDVIHKSEMNLYKSENLQRPSVTILTYVFCLTAESTSSLGERFNINNGQSRILALCSHKGALEALSDLFQQSSKLREYCWYVWHERSWLSFCVCNIQRLYITRVGCSLYYMCRL